MTIINGRSSTLRLFSHIIKITFLIFLVQLNVYGGNIQEIKDFKMCMPINEAEQLKSIDKFDFYDPLAFVTTKEEPIFYGAKFSKHLQLSFYYGKLSSIKMITNASYFQKIKDGFEKKYNKKFEFIKSKNLKKVCDYYKITYDNSEIHLVYGCGSTNNMSVNFIKQCNKL